MRGLVLDLSKYDEGIDLSKWVNTHYVWGVIIRFGGSDDGRYKDYVAKSHYEQARRLGLHIGGYYFSDSNDIDDAIEDAKHFISLLDGYEIDLPCYMDVESSRQWTVSARELTDVIKAFCDTVASAGYYPGIYTYGSRWLNNMYADDLRHYANWIAWWRSTWPVEAGDIGMWQQGCMNYNGTVLYYDPNNPEYVDFNWCIVDYPALISGESKSKEIMPTQPESNTLNDYGFGYRAYCQKVRWFNPVHDGQIAGSVGCSARLEALKFRPTADMGELTVDIHVQTYGWMRYSGIRSGSGSGIGTSDIDPICGTIDESKRIEAIKLHLDNNTTGKMLRYCGHIEGIGWTDPVWDSEICGTVGESRRLEAIRIWLDDPNNPIDISEPEETTNNIGTADAVISAAYGELGYYAPDDPEPGSKYGRWLANLTGESWMTGPSWDVWWCCMFVSWCLDQGGVVMDGFPTQHTDLALGGGGRNYAVDKYDVQYGDIVIFNWDWDSETDHIGFATGSYDGNGFTTIEGNIGNAVKELYRQMGNVAYVLRPPYANGEKSHSPSVDTNPKNNRDGGCLDVDGIGGWNTIIDWQHQLGTIEDGRIVGQVYGNKKYHSGISSVTYGDGGSKFVMTLQSKLSIEVDGHWGRDTSKAIQRWLVDHGYDIGPDGVDGYFGRTSTIALQKSLNDLKWENA